MARPANNSVVAYAPGQVPTSVDPVLAQFIQAELAKISPAINSLGEQGAFTTVAPPRPRNGMIRLADGVHWDPLVLGGVTAYYVGYANGAWVAI